MRLEAKGNKNTEKSKRLHLWGEIRGIRINFFIRKKNEKWSNWKF